MPCILSAGAAQLAVPALCMLIGLLTAYYQSTTDIEVWNGRVTAKQSVKVSRRHSYPCNCRQVCSGSGKNETCSTVCDTCYEHSYDVDWDVHASTGETVTINTIDRQGLKMPPRWDAAYIGEPFSSSHYYTNYILANPDSVLLGGKGDVETFKNLLPPRYPSDISDYYRAQHVINMGVPIEAAPQWEWLMDEVNGDFGVKDYQYLVRSFQPSSTAMIVLFIFGVLLSAGLAYFVINNDVTDGRRSRY